MGLEERESSGRSYSRRQFLQLSGVGLAAATLPYKDSEFKPLVQESGNYQDLLGFVNPLVPKNPNEEIPLYLKLDDDSNYDVYVSDQDLRVGALTRELLTHAKDQVDADSWVKKAEKMGLVQRLSTGGWFNSLKDTAAKFRQGFEVNQIRFERTGRIWLAGRGIMPVAGRDNRNRLLIDPKRVESRDSDFLLKVDVDDIPTFGWSGTLGEFDSTTNLLDIVHARVGAFVYKGQKAWVAEDALEVLVWPRNVRDSYFATDVSVNVTNKIKHILETQPEGDHYVAAHNLDQVVNPFDYDFDKAAKEGRTRRLPIGAKVMMDGLIRIKNGECVAGVSITGDTEAPSYDSRLSPVSGKIGERYLVSFKDLAYSVPRPPRRN